MLTISFTKDALKFVKSLESKPARQVYEKTISLISEPRPPSSTELKGYRGYLRLRVGDFRVVYRIIQDSIQVVVIDNRSDDEVYRHLDRLSLA
jgi:mRNA interferase RelE/StbE